MLLKTPHPLACWIMCLVDKLANFLWVLLVEVPGQGEVWGSTTKIANITLKILSGYHIRINDFLGKILSFFFWDKKIGKFLDFFFFQVKIQQIFLFLFLKLQILNIKKMKNKVKP